MSAEEVPTKRCNGPCGLELPETSFYPLNRGDIAYRHRRDARASRCIECMAAARKAKDRTDYRPRPVQYKKGGRFCNACFGMPHRVTGKKCGGCGLERAEERI